MTVARKWRLTVRHRVDKCIHNFAREIKKMRLKRSISWSLEHETWISERGRQYLQHRLVASSILPSHGKCREKTNVVTNSVKLKILQKQIGAYKLVHEFNIAKKKNFLRQIIPRNRKDFRKIFDIKRSSYTYYDKHIIFFRDTWYIV